MTQLTIDRLTMSVYLNGSSALGLNLVIPSGIESLYWFNDKSGYINNLDKTQTAITLLPAWAQTCVDVYNASIMPPANPLSLQEQASLELYATDWTSIADITDPAKCTPVLTNQPEFITYRNQLRAIVLGTQTMGIQLPQRPKATWSTK